MNGITILIRVSSPNSDVVRVVRFSDSSFVHIVKKRKEALLIRGVGLHSEAGRRKYNEDEAIMRPKFNVEQKFSTAPCVSGALSFFGVFDGHGGPKAAQFSREHLLDNLKFSLSQGFSVEDSLRYAFVRTEFDFFEKNPLNETSGTTAITILIENSTKKFWSANAGDSRAILCRRNHVVELSKDHRQSNDAEMYRIQEAGGFVRNGRAMGRLECFRTIGDADVDSKIVTAEPEIISGILCDEDEFIVLGCDGLFEVLSNEQVCAYVKEQLAEKMLPKEIVKNLVKYAIDDFGSKDNVTAVIVLLGGHLNRPSSLNLASSFSSGNTSFTDSEEPSK